jgi:hypothetical protein
VLCHAADIGTIVRGAYQRLTGSIALCSSGMDIQLVGRAPFALEGLGVERRPEAKDKLTFDLSGLELASPLDVAALALLAGCVDEGPQVIAPHSEEVTAYLGAMGLPAAIGWSPDVPPAVDTGFSIPVRRLEHPDEWEDTARALSGPMHEELGRDVADSVWQVLGELADNAGTHGASPVGYYIAGQFYSGRSSHMVSGMWIAVVDAGIGIRAHLSQTHGEISNDESAIKLAVQPGVTGTYPPRGYGLVDVRRYAGRQAPGRVLIRSGAGFGLSYPAPKGTGRTARYGSLQPVPGTWVMVLVGDPR